MYPNNSIKAGAEGKEGTNLSLEELKPGPMYVMSSVCGHKRVTDVPTVEKL